MAANNLSTFNDSETARLNGTPRQSTGKDGVLPKSTRGRYELVPVVRAYIRFLREKTVNTDVGADDYAAHRARLTSAKS